MLRTKARKSARTACTSAFGPNNWTNAGDPDMPPFGSLPGMKMMPVKGRGWAARELAIDGNAPLAWMAWWSEHRAAPLLGRSQIGEEGIAAHLADVVRTVRIEH